MSGTSATDSQAIENVMAQMKQIGISGEHMQNV